METRKQLFEELKKNKKMLAFLNGQHGKAWGKWWNKFAPTFAAWFFHDKNPTMGQMIESYIDAFQAGLKEGKLEG